MASREPARTPQTPDEMLHALSGELARLESAFDDLPVAYYRADEQGNILRANEVFRTLTEDGAPVGRSLAAVYARPEAQAELLQRLRSEGGYTLRVVELADGTRVEERARLRRSDKGDVVDAVLLDVTEQVAYERELDQYARALDSANTRLRRHVDALDAFTYGVSHDLKTPVRGILAYLDALHEDLDDIHTDLPENVERYLDGVRHEAERMERMISGLLQMARFQRLPTQGVSDLDALVDDVLEAHRRTMVSRSVRVERPETLPRVPVSEDVLRAVLTNLVGNAIKYADPEAPRICIRVDRRQDEEHDDWVLSIEDNGKGIHESMRESVFKLFFRVPGETAEGTGVGLAIVRMLVEAWNGSVWIEDAEAGGAAFRFSVPALESAEDA